MKITDKDLNLVDKDEIDDILKKTEQKFLSGEYESIALEEFLKIQEENRKIFYKNLKI